MRHTCWHVALEPIPSRYSEQWLRCLKPEFEKYAGREWNMYDLLGDPIEGSDKPTPGVFLNLTATNAWKASQVIKLSHLFAKGYVTPGDVFLFTDAWNPAIIQVRYMADLMKIPVRIVSMWHAGSYDPWDYLGYTIKDKRWSYAAERAFFDACDVNVFATQFHANLYLDTIRTSDWTASEKKICFSGQPHYEIIKKFDTVVTYPRREDLVVFPHRIGREKQPEIFEALRAWLPHYRMEVCQKMNLTKEGYYTTLLKSKVCFSCSLQETLGISQMEAVLAGSIPLMPDSLSYHEMYDSDFLYPPEWIENNADNLDANWLANLSADIETCVFNFDSTYWQNKLAMQKTRLIANYLTCEPMFDAIIGEK